MAPVIAAAAALFPRRPSNVAFASAAALARLMFLQSERGNLWFKSRAEIHSESAACMRQQAALARSLAGERGTNERAEQISRVVIRH